MLGAMPAPRPSPPRAARPPRSAPPRPAPAARLLAGDAGGRVRLYLGECRGLGAALGAEPLDLVYADPPFGTGARRRGRAGLAFSDGARGGPEAYAAWLVERLAPLWERLGPAGSLYVHLDWRSVHYAKVALDRALGARCFLNEIVWIYGLGGSSPRRWPRKHDTLLWYARTPGRQWFEAPRVAARSRRLAGRDKKAPSWWDIPALNNMARERVGWPTQKPEALLERVVRSSCPPGGLVADPFAGSGTTAVAALRHGRRAVLCDADPRALALARRRLEALGVTWAAG